MKKRLISIAIIAASCVLSGGVSAMTLLEAIKSGQEYNLAGKMADTQADSARYKVQESYAAYWPQVNLTGKTRTGDYQAGSSYQREDDEAAMLNATVQYTLLDYARGEQVRSTKNALEAADFNAQIQREKLSFDIIKACVDVWKKDRIAYLTDEYARTVGELSGKIEARVSGGLSPESDSVRAQAAVDDARTQQENASKDLADARMTLLSMTGRADAVNGVIDERTKPFMPYLVSQQELEKESLLLKLLNSQTEQKKSEYEYTRKDDYPKVQFIGNYKDRYNVHAESPDMQVFIQMSVPLFNGFHTRNKLGEVASEVRLSEYKLESAARDLKKNYGVLLMEINKTQGIWVLNKRAIDKSEKTLVLYEQEFTMGNRPLSDIISSQRELFSARKNEVDTKSNFYNYVAAVYNLYGKTTDSIKYIEGGLNVR